MNKAVREIVQGDAPVLRAVAIAVPETAFNTSELNKLIQDMSASLDEQPEGVALAAPQIGVSWRLFIVRTDRTVPVEQLEETGSGRIELKPHVDVYINPEVLKTSRKRSSAEEGCLSVRGVYGTTHPHERVTIRAQRPDGTSFERGAGGLMAQIFEHEINHLNGILFIDHAEHIIDVPHVAEG
jgi:peptide deformylase